MTLNTDAPYYDAPDAADDDAVYPYSFQNHKNKKNNMTTNTDAPDDDAPIFPMMMLPPPIFILDFSRKCKIYPKSMLTLFFLMTVTDSDSTTDYAYPTQ